VKDMVGLDDVEEDEPEVEKEDEDTE